ncbi:MAG: hypothetical protein OXN90_06670 [Gemmatimonadota bacterium]|nr:hypothetical protein [Gemmatimonadota bacterium]
MKRIGTLNGMGWLVLALVLQTSYTAVVVAQAINEAASPIQRTPSPNVSLDYWTGRIEQDTTWRDTVYVIGDVTIASGATLTLAPDTQVHFLPYRDDTQDGLDSTRAELIVEGRLHAQVEGIVFRSAATSLGADWYGIVVERGGLADVSNAAIRDGLRCLYAKMGGRVTMDHIAFANCGKQIGVSQNSTRPPKVLARRANREEEANTRIGKKLVAGGLVGLGGGLVGGAIALDMEVRSQPEAELSTDYSLAGIFAAFWGFLGGYTVGTAAGVSSVDPHDRFISSLGGSVVGLIGGIGLTTVGPKAFWPSLLIGPLAMATNWSERSRKLLEFHRFSVCLVPDTRGHLSAVATLRF